MRREDDQVNVTVYATPTCPHCHHVKDFLNRRGVEFVERDVSAERGAAEEMFRMSGQMGVPVVVVDGEVVVGFNRGALERLLTGKGDGKRPVLGVQVADASRVAARYGLVPILGALVGGVAPSSLGEKAGLRKGDIITEVNLRPVHNADSLEAALSALAHGSRLMIVLQRGQATLKSEIVV